MTNNQQPLPSLEGIRQLVELAVSSGRNRQSSQTGYIHVYYPPVDEDVQMTIPLIENVLFALALMRTRTVDNIQEAKTILEKILYFQNIEEETSRGNFPIYLHDYPFCKDRLLGAHLVAPFYWILKQFGHILGSALKLRLENALHLLNFYCLETYTSKKAPYPLAVKIGAGAAASGALLQEQNMEEQGAALLRTLEENPESSFWCTPAALSDILPSLQLVYPSIKESPWKPLWSHLSQTWQASACAYAGPGWREYQVREEPQPTLYDLFMGYLSGTFSYRSFVDHPYQMHAALIQPIEDSLESPPEVVEGTIEGNKWMLVNRPDYACVALAKEKAINPGHEKGLHYFKLLWGDRTRVRTFACQGGRVEGSHYHFPQNGVFEMEFTLESTEVNEEREKNREVVLFLDNQEETRFTVGGQPTTTFKLDDEIVLETGDRTFRLSFHLIEGEGVFMGHIMPGNRPAQQSLVGAQRFQAFDWQFFIRSIKRSEICRIKMVFIASRFSSYL